VVLPGSPFTKEKLMHTFMLIVFIAVALFVIYGALQYGNPKYQEIVVHGVFASDGTRLDQRQHLLSDRSAKVPASFPSSIRASGDVSVTIGADGGILITGRGPRTGHVTLRT